MFPSSTIIRELAMNLAKVIFMVKYLVKLRHYYYYAVVWQHVMEWHNNNDVISPNVLP